MATIWSVQTIYGNPPASSDPNESTTKSHMKVADSQAAALGEYGERFKAGLPADAAFANIYLWRSDPGPQRRVHNVVKHAHFWKDQNGTHCNEFSGAVQV